MRTSLTHVVLLPGCLQPRFQKLAIPSEQDQPNMLQRSSEACGFFAPFDSTLCQAGVHDTCMMFSSFFRDFFVL